ncbi:DUF2975 family protein [Algoriphagus boseongensis]|uniref:DUF2975 family protein n=1 Tax=Algoriphagus boseongensis TaxID=1442587 RepID=A0A4R6T524_9BACT|nr:DUF2975 domain-containing protein [Algoriphagus boseongensis]TDQ15064.1 DUF2975 family protein [Algoriphagus boseongensis]
MSAKTETIFKILKVFSWIVFIGLSIKAGALIFNYIFAWFNPAATHNLYDGLDLSALYQSNEIYYQSILSLLIILSISKAHVFYLIIQIQSKLNLVKPFSEGVSELILKISYSTFFIGILGWFTREFSRWLEKRGYELGSVGGYWEDYQAFFMMAGIIFIIAQIFKKGLELQNENDLTV